MTSNHPNDMWGTDGIRIETIDQGWVWVFAAGDFFDAFCVGIHAVKTGNRFAALQPITQGLQSEFCTTGAVAVLGRWAWVLADCRCAWIMEYNISSTT
jgi:putative transposase